MTTSLRLRPPRLEDEAEFIAGHEAMIAQYRRRGWATEILRQSLVIVRAFGVDRVLVTCDDNNVGSAVVIERCGGVFDSLSTADDGHPVRRYWID